MITGQQLGFHIFIPPHAFNVIQLVLLRTTSWPPWRLMLLRCRGTWTTILDILSMNILNCVFDTVVRITGTPLGAVLSPFLFIWYNSDCRTVFSDWCELNHLQLNISKTTEVVVGFRRSGTPASPLSIAGATGELQIQNIVQISGQHTQLDREHFCYFQEGPVLALYYGDSSP